MYQEAIYLICVPGNYVVVGHTYAWYGKTKYVHWTFIDSMRVCHYIKPNHKSESPTRLAFLTLNIEPLCVVDGVTKYEWFGGSLITADYDKRSKTWSTEKHTVFTASEIWHWLTVTGYAKIRRYLWIENSNYVLTFLHAFQMHAEYGWEMTRAVIPSGPTIINYRKGKSCLTILDMSNIWRPQFAGIWTGEITLDSSENCNADAPLQKLEDASVRNALNMKKVTEWLDFLKTNDLGGFSPTAGAQSFRTWRHRYMTHTVLIDLHDKALQLARDGFYGGRCECFRLGEVRQKVYELDITASYPWAMRQMVIPCKLQWYSDYVSKEDIDKWVDEHIIIADCSIHTEGNVFPFKSDDGLMFPIGRFRTVLSGVEFFVAWASGAVEKVHRAACYTAERAFTSYMDAMWMHRSASAKFGNLEESEKWKLLMNSFFGKWAQHGHTWEDAGKADTLDIRSDVVVDVDTHTIEHYRQFGGRIQKLSTETEARESSPAIAACVSAWVRAALVGYMDDAGLENVFYCDTDSILCNDVGLRRLHHKLKPGEFGGLRIKNEYDRVVFYGPKHYRPSVFRRISGIRPNAHQINDTSYTQPFSQSLSGQIAGNVAGGACSIEQTKTFTKGYTKGEVQEDGRVVPFRK